MKQHAINHPLQAIHYERIKQDKRWGEQNHPDGTGSEHFAAIAQSFKDSNDALAEAGEITWAKILEEEVYEAFAESDPDKLYEELTQVAAVAVAWMDALNRRALRERTTD